MCIRDSTHTHTSPNVRNVAFFCWSNSYTRYELSFIYLPVHILTVGATTSIGQRVPPSVRAQQVASILHLCLYCSHFCYSLFVIKLELNTKYKPPTITLLIIFYQVTAFAFSVREFRVQLVTANVLLKTFNYIFTETQLTINISLRVKYLSKFLYRGSAFVNDTWSLAYFPWCSTCECQNA